MIRLAALSLLLAAASALAVPDHLQGVPANAGFIFAKVTWPEGESQEGFLRWEDEEAFWDDLFHSGQRDLPWTKYADTDLLRAERRNRFYSKKGMFDRIMYALTEDRKDPVSWRIFLARMGDIRSIEIHDGEDDFVITADGSRHRIGGYANDDGSDLLLYSGRGDPQQIDWNDLANIEFLPVPAGAVPYAERLYGTLESTEGIYTGFIQWDKTECLSIDVLDGEDPEGKGHDVPMGDIRSIARHDAGSAEVVLKDGRTLLLSGTNDVNSGNRGIMVELPEMGRISVPWKHFRKLSFEDPGSSGYGRDAFHGQAALQGTVTRTEGEPLTGRLVIDLDKAWRWNLFSGTLQGQDYDIPLPLIRSLQRMDAGTCRVTLLSGRTLDLSESTETGSENAGVLVFPADNGDPTYVPWRVVDRVTLTGGQ